MVKTVENPVSSQNSRIMSNNIICVANAIDEMTVITRSRLPGRKTYSSTNPSSSTTFTMAKKRVSASFPSSSPVQVSAAFEAYITSSRT